MTLTAQYDGTALTPLDGKSAANRTEQFEKQTLVSLIWTISRNLGLIRLFLQFNFYILFLFLIYFYFYQRSLFFNNENFV